MLGPSLRIQKKIRVSSSPGSVFFQQAYYEDLFTKASFTSLIVFFVEPIKFERHSYAEPTETWGYVDVRQSAHMFYWLYYTTNSAGFKNTPLVMWLQVWTFSISILATFSLLQFTKRYRFLFMT